MLLSRRFWLRASGMVLLAAAALAPTVFAPSAIGAMSPVSEFVDGRMSRRAPFIQYDGVGRLVAYPDKKEVACPEQDARTAVILVAGQSNAANSTGQKFVTMHGDKVISLFDGRCALAQSPLLGASGEWGEMWTLLGNRLVASGAFDRVVIVPAAIGGSAIETWAHGSLDRVLPEAISSARGHYAITHVLWHQGESDFMLGTSPADYRARLLTVARGIRRAGVLAPIYVAVSTRCANSATTWSPGNDIARAQRTIVDPELSLYAGVDADSLLDGLDRYDDCHLSSSGVSKLVDSWIDIIAGRAARG